MIDFDPTPKNERFNFGNSKLICPSKHYWHACIGLFCIVWINLVLSSISFSAECNQSDSFQSNLLPHSAGMDGLKSCPTVTLEFQLPRLFYISETTSGGSLKYLMDLKIVCDLGGIEVIRLPNLEIAAQKENKMRPNDFLIFQYLFNTDFTFEFVRDLVVRKQLRLILPVHDRYFLGEKYEINDLLHNASMPLSPIQMDLFKMAEHIIFPSTHVYQFFRPFVDLNTMKIVPHIDIMTPWKECTPPITDGRINIGIIHEISPTKGERIIQHLIQNMENIFDKEASCAKHLQFYVYWTYDTHSPNVTVRGPYKENMILSDVVNDTLHGLLFLNEYPETYSYALTKGFFTGLPMLYTDIGAVGERVKARYDPEHLDRKEIFVATNNDDIFLKFNKFLAAICSSSNFVGGKECRHPPHTKVPMKFPSFYDELFFESEESIKRRVSTSECVNRDDYKNIQNQIEPYAIYFPQFHETAENNLNFYAGYTDMTNLADAKRLDPSLWTPLRNMFGLYDLEKNWKVVPNQIQTAKAYGLSGFAIYYYYFSTNTVSNQCALMTKIIDRFFEEDIPDFSVFFVYANEGWTSNVAFETGGTSQTIQMSWTESAITNNFEFLIPYFKHSNYRKIDNRPVFFLHHPHQMSVEEINLFHSVGERITRKHGFSGFYLVLNGIRVNNFPHYVNHPQYKGEQAIHFFDFSTQPKRIDYKYYTDYYLQSKFISEDADDAIKTAFVNFDNSVRFHTHDDDAEFGALGKKINFITRTKGSDALTFRRFLDEQFKEYKNNKRMNVSRIFLINAWNEWGEQMVLEPSQEKGFLYLNVLKQALLCNFIGKC